MAQTPPAPVTAQTLFNIASVAKPISAVVAMRLVETGQLNLDQPMQRFDGFPAFCRSARAAGGVFFRDIACEDERLTLRRVLSMTANAEPGSAFSYNPVLYSWASRPMMEVAGKPFSAMVAEHVFQPAAITASLRLHRALPLPAPAQALLAAPHARGADGKMHVAPPPPPPQGDGAAGGVVATAADLARFDIALDAGKLIRASSRTMMWAPAALSGGGVAPYALGWFARTVGGERMVWHTGLRDNAYSALYLKLPDRRATLILLANSDGLNYPTPLNEARIENSPFAAAFVAFAKAALCGAAECRSP